MTDFDAREANKRRDASIGAHAALGSSPTSMSCSLSSPRPWRSRSERPRSATRSALAPGCSARPAAARHRRWIAGRGADARFGLNLFEAFGRIWLLAGAIVLAGVVGGRADGLTAALVIFGAYSIAFAMRVVEGRPGGSRP